MAVEETNKRIKIEPVLGWLALFLMLIGCFFILRPFMTALMWAMVLAYSLYPMQRRFTGWFRGSRTLAACFVTLTMTVLLAGPVALIGLSIAQDGKDLATATKKWFRAAPDQAPEWVAQAPFIGDDLAGYWASFAEDRDRWMDQLEKEVKTEPRPKIVIENGDETILQDPPPPRAAAGEQEEEKPPTSAHAVALLGQFIVWARAWLLTVTFAVGQGITQVLISAFLAFFLLRDADILADRLSVAVGRLAGGRGPHLIKVAGDTVRGVIYGILGTAIAQAVVAGIGFWIAGVPGAVLLSVLTFFCAVVPFGPPVVWLPAALWLFAQDQPGYGIFMLIWGMFGISGVDNFLRPYLISQGSKMPFVLIFCGVIGGGLTFGLVGVFMGPTLLAVTFRIIEEWSAKRPLPDTIVNVTPTSGLQADPLSRTELHGGESFGVR